MRTYLDTDTAVWLVNGSIEKFSAAALERIENSRLRISPLVTFEARLLQEAGRPTIGPDEIEAILMRDFEVQIRPVALPKVVEASYGEPGRATPLTG